MNTIVEALKNSPDILELMLNELPSNRYNMTFKNADWSIIDHLVHLLETQDIFLERLRLFKDEESPRIQAFFPEEGETDSKSGSAIIEPDVEKLISSFREVRNRQIDFIQNLPDKVYSRKGSHSEHSSPLSFNRLLLHFLSHDHYHYYRIEELGSFKEENITSW